MNNPDYVEFPTQLQRCVTCNHLASLHNDTRCICKEFPTSLVHLEICKCPNSRSSMRTYIGATSYFIAQSQRQG